MDFSKFLSAFEGEDSMAFLLFTVGAFLIGFFFTWLGYGRRANRRKAEAGKARAELKAMQAEYGAFKEQYELKEADLRRAELDADAARRMVAEFEGEREEMQRNLYLAQEDVEKAQATLHAYATTIEDLNNQIIGLKAKNQSYASGAPVEAVSDDRLIIMQKTQDATLAKLAELEARLANAQVTSNSGAGKAPVIQEDAVERADDSLRRRIKTNGNGSSAVYNEKEAVIEADKVALAKEQVQTSFGKSIPLATPGAADDLKKIDGIGSFLEQKLNDIGIYTYEQIAQLDDESIVRITNAIEFFPGRIKKDDWVGQANKLLGRDVATGSESADDSVMQIELEADEPAQPIAPAPTSDTTAPTGKVDNLKKIEGIGPKIEQLLNFAGINSFEELANTKVETIKEILANGGKRFKMHDPTTWPEQSRLAAAGNWDDLKKYQDYLNGGRG